MTPAGLDQLKLDEGLKLVAYPDPKSGGGPWTIGYGQTGSGIKEGTAWTKGQADDAILARVHLIEKQLSGQLNFFSKLKGRKIILVGGAIDHCLKDIEVSMETFGLDITIQHKFIYSGTYCYFN